MIGVGTRVRVVYGREVTRGVAVTDMKIARTISRNINLKKATLGSQETHAHGQIQDLRHGFHSVDGSFNTEWSLGAQDDWLEDICGSLWSTNVLKIGTSLTTNTIERQFLDLGQYEVYKGVAMNSAEFRIQPESIVGITFNTLGMAPVTPSTTPSDASPTAAATNQPFDSFTGAISEGGSPIAIVTGVTFNINRGRTLGPVIGSKYSPDVFEGTGIITGSVTAYFQNFALYLKFRNEAWSTMEVNLNDLDAPAKGYDILFPRIKYTGNDKDPPREGPVVETMPFQATYDQTVASSLQITRRP